MIIVGVEDEGCTVVKDNAIVESVSLIGDADYCCNQAVELISGLAEEEEVFVCLVANISWFASMVHDRLAGVPRVTFAREDGPERKIGIYVNSSMRRYAKGVLDDANRSDSNQKEMSHVPSDCVVAAIGSMIANRYYTPASQSEQL